LNQAAIKHTKLEERVMPKNLWNNTDAPDSDGLESLAYRSRLLGTDRSLVNIYGGNTSTKSLEKDHLGRDVMVLWVKGSGSDIADITQKGFAGLKLEEVLPLFERPSMSDEEMVAYLDRTTFEVGRPRQSIETLLHAFVPAKHVDHTHPDAVIAIACSENGQNIMTDIYGERAAMIASKNSIAAGKNAAAYSAAKAAELHLARCLAEEGGAAGIRVNSVLPDAVLSGSAIWNSSWKEERAKAYGIKPEELDEFYRKRTTLRVNVFPEDIAQAVYFFASPASSKTTGGVLTVDGGVPTAYVR
jgi:NAD(P)-dependent dehydrogenase (short-subunit alcohol dehydrogenase family)